MKQKHRVVMVSPDLDVMGGISFVVLEYLNNGLQNKVQLTFIPTTKDGTVGQKIIFFMVAIKKILWSLLCDKGDIYHCNVSQDGSFYRKLIIFFMAKLFRKKVVVHVHGSNFEEFMKKRAVNRHLTKFMFSNSKLIIALSNRSKSIIEKFESKAKVIKLFNPVSFPKIIEQKTEPSLNILFLGKLSYRKGTYDLLDVICKKKDYFVANKAKFIIAGNGDIEKVRIYAKRNELEELVKIPGWASGNKKRYYLANADIYVLPSYHEQMPMSILEAMAYGLPVISTTVAGIPEIVNHCQNGILIKPGDQDSLSAALTELIENEQKRRLMGAQSLKIVADKFEGKVIVDQLVKVYDNL